ncbi:Protein bfr2 [Leucoagaricus sp. SymC.cos]|nr:Protein bfr2 [Leucoagaricus sp. SymC.cos]
MFLFFFSSRHLRGASGWMDVSKLEFMEIVISSRSRDRWKIEFRNAFAKSPFLSNTRMSTGRLSLAQQLAQLDQPAPVDLDPEDLAVHERGSDDEGRATSTAAREHYFEVGPSSLRKLHDSVSDSKYEGVKTSRKKLMEILDKEEDEAEEDEDESEEDEEGLDSEQEDDAVEGPEESGRDEEIDSEVEEDEEQLPERTATSQAPTRKSQEPPSTEVLTNSLQRTREEDLRKGKAVVRQMSLWDSLLDARIRLQKTATTVNKVTSVCSRSILESAECQESLRKYLEASILLAEDLFELQEMVLSMNEVATSPPRKKRRIQEDDTLESYTAYFDAASDSTAKLEQAVHPWLVQTLTKWSAKIQAVAPSVLLPSNRNAFSKNSQNVKSAVQMVDEALLDHPRLLAKTRLARGKTKSEAADGKEDNEIFDDTDFYQQLLRDVIEFRGDGAGGADDWMALQREKKAKKKMDTKASKGRKLRYEVHEKLQNFMVPVPVASSWHEEQIDELFTSLLGKGFESTLVDDAPLLDAERTVEVDEAIRGGFRVFG